MTFLTLNLHKNENNKNGQISQNEKDTKTLMKKSREFLVIRADAGAAVNKNM